MNKLDSVLRLGRKGKLGKFGDPADLPLLLDIEVLLLLLNGLSTILVDAGVDGIVELEAVVCPSPSVSSPPSSSSLYVSMDDAESDRDDLVRVSSGKVVVEGEDVDGDEEKDDSNLLFLLLLLELDDDTDPPLVLPPAPAKTAASRGSRVAPNLGEGEATAVVSV